MASGLFLAWFVWRSVLPSPSPHSYWAGGGEGRGKRVGENSAGRGRGCLPSPARWSAPPARPGPALPLGWGGWAAPSVCSPPPRTQQPSYWSVFLWKLRVEGGTPRGGRERARFSVKTKLFYTSQRRALPPDLALSETPVQRSVARSKEACRVDPMYLFFFRRGCRSCQQQDMWLVIIVVPRKG